MLATELLMVLPVLIALVVAVIAMSTQIGVQQRAGAAAREGARLASVGTSPLDIENAVRMVLGAALSEGAVVETMPGQITGPDGSTTNVVAVTVTIQPTKTTSRLFSTGPVVGQSIMRME